jgi:hypothetical protein
MQIVDIGNQLVVPHRGDWRLISPQFSLCSCASHVINKSINLYVGIRVRRNLPVVSYIGLSVYTMNTL